MVAGVLTLVEAVRSVTVDIVLRGDIVDPDGEVEAEVRGEDDVVARHGTGADEVSLPLLALEAADVQLVNVEAAPHDVRADVGAGVYTVEPITVLGLQGEVLPLLLTVLERVVGAGETDGVLLSERILHAELRHTKRVVEHVRLDGELLRLACHSGSGDEEDNGKEYAENLTMLSEECKSVAQALGKELVTYEL